MSSCSPRDWDHRALPPWLLHEESIDGEIKKLDPSSQLWFQSTFFTVSKYTTQWVEILSLQSLWPHHCRGITQIFHCFTYISHWLTSFKLEMYCNINLLLTCFAASYINKCWDVTSIAHNYDAWAKSLHSPTSFWI